MGKQRMTKKNSVSFQSYVSIREFSPITDPTMKDKLYYSQHDLYKIKMQAKLMIMSYKLQKKLQQQQQQHLFRENESHRRSGMMFPTTTTTTTAAAAADEQHVCCCDGDGLKRSAAASGTARYANDPVAKRMRSNTIVVVAV